MGSYGLVRCGLRRLRAEVEETAQRRHPAAPGQRRGEQLAPLLPRRLPLSALLSAAVHAVATQRAAAPKAFLLQFFRKEHMICSRYIKKRIIL